MISMKSTTISLMMFQSPRFFAFFCGAFASAGLFIFTLRHVDLLDHRNLPINVEDLRSDNEIIKIERFSSCATVEEMGNNSYGTRMEEKLRLRRKIVRHFVLYGSRNVRNLPPGLFCKHGFVLGKSSEAGFGNEMYKILTAAALSIMLNRSLIIGQTSGKFPFGDFISYSNDSFTLKEVKHLWRSNGCLKKYGKHLTIRTDDFLNPAKTNVLCSNWRKWEQPIIWFQGTTDSVAAQFFLKNVHSDMRNTAYELFGGPDIPSRPNVFGELMRLLVHPTQIVEDAVNWAIGTGINPDISLHMRMLMRRSPKAIEAAVSCARKVVEPLAQGRRPKVALISDTPDAIESMKQYLQKFSEVLSFDYKHFNDTLGLNSTTHSQTIGFRVRDWGPAPRWVSFVDFFLASRAKHVVISGAHRRVGTTYVQLIAALAAAQNLDKTGIDGEEGWGEFRFVSSIHSRLVERGLSSQVGWGHVWNRYGGYLSCHNQLDQCALTSLLPSAWWDLFWQSPVSPDFIRLERYGVRLSPSGVVDDRYLTAYCDKRRDAVNTIVVV